VKHLFTGFFIFLAVCIFTSCPEPAGSIGSGGGGGGGGANLSLLLVYPEKTEYRYDRDEVFNPPNDLRISYTENGSLKTISPLDPDITITIFDNPNSDVVLSQLTSDDPVYVFSQAGTHHVKVTYKNIMSFPERYTIHVLGANDDPGGSGEGGFGTMIIW